MLRISHLLQVVAPSRQIVREGFDTIGRAVKVFEIRPLVYGVRHMDHLIFGYVERLEVVFLGILRDGLDVVVGQVKIDQILTPFKLLWPNFKAVIACVIIC